MHQEGSRVPNSERQELEELELLLSALTVRVTRLRTRFNVLENDEQPRIPTPPVPRTDAGSILSRPFVLGDQIRFRGSTGRFTEGTIVGFTPRRIQIREHRTNHILLRAPHNITLLRS